MSFATIDALRESPARPTVKARSPEYVARMMHEVPKATVVDRAAFILERVTGKRVLELGASGAMHAAIVQAAAHCFGVDRQYAENVLEFDLDDVRTEVLPRNGEAVDVVVCGEVIEHLSNPGWLLQRLKQQRSGVPVIVTVPNAFSEVAAAHLEHGIENVNADHVAWYSYRTLRTLLERAGYVIDSFHWYGGDPLTGEGLIMVAR